MKTKTLLTLALALIALAAPAAADTTLSVSNVAPLAGSFSMRTTFSPPLSGALAYVQDNSPENETVYSASFKLNSDDPALAANWANATSQQIFVGREDTTNQISLRVNLYRNAVGAAQPFALHVFMVNDAGAFISPRTAVNTNPGTHEYTVEWHAGTGAGDGFVKVFRDGDCRKRADNQDNDTRQIDYVQLGKPGAQQNALAGFIAFDDFASFRTPQYPDNTCP